MSLWAGFSSPLAPAKATLFGKELETWRNAITAHRANRTTPDCHSAATPSLWWLPSLLARIYSQCFSFCVSAPAHPQSEGNMPAGIGWELFVDSPATQS